MALSNYHDETTTLSALDCEIALNTTGSAVAQPLEAALKALSPAIPNASGSLSIANAHGDRENAGFFRNNVAAGYAGRKLIVFVTNRDDCSSAQSTASSADDALQRCREHPEQLAPLQRYIQGLHELYDYSDKGLLVAILAGIPPDLLTQEPNDPPEARSYYDAILQDPRMQWRASASGSGFEPSCMHSGEAMYPARRLVELAKQLGYYKSALGSLCDDDLTTVIYDLLLLNASRADPVNRPGNQCVPTRPARSAAGYVPCHMTWELPAMSEAWRPTTFTKCADRPAFLSVPVDPQLQVGPHGGALCDVNQAPLVDLESNTFGGTGFYFDNHSDECPYTTPQVTYTPDAFPPEGVRVHLSCVSNAPRYDSGDVTVPSIGDSCELTEPAFFNPGLLCSDNEWSHRHSRFKGKGQLFCHPDRKVCMMECQRDKDCPDGWLCDAGTYPLSAGAGRPVCVNPSCDWDQ